MICSLGRLSHECEQKICGRNEHCHEQEWQGNVSWQIFAIIVLLFVDKYVQISVFYMCDHYLEVFDFFFFLRKNQIVDGQQKIHIECSLFMACEWSVK